MWCRPSSLVPLLQAWLGDPLRTPSSHSCHHSMCHCSGRWCPCRFFLVSWCSVRVCLHVRVVCWLNATLPEHTVAHRTLACCIALFQAPPGWRPSSAGARAARWLEGCLALLAAFFIMLPFPYLPPASMVGQA